MKKILCLAIFGLGLASTYAATLVFTDGKTMTKVNVVSINFAKKFMLVERDGQQRSIPLNQIAEFYSQDQKTGDTGFDDNTAEYSISINEIKMPKTGYEKGNSKKTHSTADCEITYSVMTTPSQKSGVDQEKVRYPYFYLAVMTNGNNEYGNRPVFRYTYPADKFKLKSKDSYNTAEIMEEINSLKRPILYLDRNAGLKSKGLASGLPGGEREIKISLKRINDREILAYHLEVWGRDKIIATKDWHSFNLNTNEKWMKSWWLK